MKTSGVILSPWSPHSNKSKCEKKIEERGKCPCQARVGSRSSRTRWTKEHMIGQTFWLTQPSRLLFHPTWACLGRSIYLRISTFFFNSEKVISTSSLHNNLTIVYSKGHNTKGIDSQILLQNKNWTHWGRLLLWPKHHTVHEHIEKRLIWATHFQGAAALLKPNL